MKFFFIIFILFFSFEIANSGWNLEYSYPESKYFYKLFFLNNNTGWILGEDNIFLKTSNSGLDWITQDIQDIQKKNIIIDLFFIDEKKGWVVCDSGQIFKTTDGCKSWTQQFSDEKPHVLLGIKFFDENIGLAFYLNGAILKTTDGGEHWIKKSSGIDEFLSNIFFLNTEIGWGVSWLGGRILKTTDGGINWQIIQYTNWYEFTSVYFINEKLGWVTGKFGVILKTVDGGDTWIEKSNDTYLTMNKIYFIDSLKGWVANEFSRIYNTTDGGNSWNFESSKIGNIYDIIFTDENTGWALCTNGKVLKYSDSTTYINEKVHVTSNIIFPNPATDYIYIQPSDGWQPSEGSNIQTFDILGELVAQTSSSVNYQSQTGTSDPLRIDISKLTSGMYFVKIGNRVEKFVKM